MKIHIFNKQRDLPLRKESAKKIILAGMNHLKATCEEIAIYFVTQKKISDLHQEFFQDPTPTDCISFPIDPCYLGDIFVCPSVAIRYAKENDRDPYEETALYIIHGLLHLLGYDDLEEKEKRAMRKKEKSCMDLLRALKLSLNPDMDA